MKDEKPNIAEAMITDALVLVGVILMVMYVVIADGIVVKLLWLWFIVPLGVAQITYMHAAGIALFVRFLAKAQKAEVKKEYREDKKTWLLFLKPWIILLMGYIISRYM